VAKQRDDFRDRMWRGFVADQHRGSRNDRARFEFAGYLLMIHHLTPDTTQPLVATAPPTGSAIASVQVRPRGTAQRFRRYQVPRRVDLAVTAINRAFRRWRDTSALLGALQAGGLQLPWPEHRSLALLWMRLSPKQRDLLGQFRALIDRAAFLAIIEWGTRYGQHEDARALLSAFARGGEQKYPRADRHGLATLLPAHETVPSFPADNPAIRKWAERLGSAPEALARLTWCFLPACTTRAHQHGPLYFDRAERPDRPSVGCCQAHTRAIHRKAPMLAAARAALCRQHP
jgi:hypothetical protein